MQAVADGVINFTAVFLGIFIEAMPFLLLGTLASGVVEVFVSRDDLLRAIPRSSLLGPVVGSLMGLVFPVCECGVVPLTRRLLRKGMPASTGIAFLLAAPILNPVVFASTYAAYGWGTILLARLGLGLLVALAVGLIFSLNPNPAHMLVSGRALAGIPEAEHSDHRLPAAPVLRADRFRRALRIAGDEFFEMGRYLVIGSLAAALMQTVVPQQALLAIGSAGFVSVIVMQVTAFVLSVCSTVDAFVSLAFAGTFSTGAILAFLVYGPMVDIKSTLLFLGVFRGKVVAYLVMLPFLMTLLGGVLVNVVLR